MTEHPITDFGWLVQYLGNWMIVSWWGTPITLFGLTTTIGAITAWVVIGSILIWFIDRMIN